MKHIAVLLFLLLTVAGRGHAQDSDYPFQTQAGFTINASVVQVDPDRDRVQATGDDGKTYTLDTYKAAIILLGTTRTGQTGDLVEGMRVHVEGLLVSGSIIEAKKVSVLPFRPPAPRQPAGQHARRRRARIPARHCEQC